MRKQVTKTVWVDCCKYCGLEIPSRPPHLLIDHERRCALYELYEQGCPAIKVGDLFWNGEWRFVAGVTKVAESRDYRVRHQAFSLEGMEPDEGDEGTAWASRIPRVIGMEDARRTREWFLQARNAINKLPKEWGLAVEADLDGACVPQIKITLPMSIRETYPPLELDIKERPACENK